MQEHKCGDIRQLGVNGGFHSAIVSTPEPFLFFVKRRFREDKLDFRRIRRDDDSWLSREVWARWGRWCGAESGEIIGECVPEGDWAPPP